LRRSPANGTVYKRAVDEVYEIKQAEKEYWLCECNKLIKMKDQDKWKAIQKLTNHQTSHGVQPLRVNNNGTDSFLFEDSEIRTELENVYIRKTTNCISAQRRNVELVQAVDEMKKAASEANGNELMNADTSDVEVESTFGIGSDTSGPDGILAKLINKANRSVMLKCLQLLWNQLWCTGNFVSVWKKEDRVVIPKPGKKDYHESAAYRTVAITSVVGKRFKIHYCKKINFGFGRITV